MERQKLLCFGLSACTGQKQDDAQRRRARVRDQRAFIAGRRQQEFVVKWQQQRRRVELVMRRKGARGDWKRDRLVKATERMDGVAVSVAGLCRPQIDETEVQRIYDHKPDEQPAERSASGAKARGAALGGGVISSKRFCGRQNSRTTDHLKSREAKRARAFSNFNGF